MSQDMRSLLEHLAVNRDHLEGEKQELVDFVSIRRSRFESQVTQARQLAEELSDLLDQDSIDWDKACPVVATLKSLVLKASTNEAVIDAAQEKIVYFENQLKRSILDTSA